MTRDELVNKLNAWSTNAKVYIQEDFNDPDSCVSQLTVIDVIDFKDGAGILLAGDDYLYHKAEGK